MVCSNCGEEKQDKWPGPTCHPCTRKKSSSSQAQNLYKNRQKLPIIENDFGHWFSGFVDGEGCFSLSRRDTRHGIHVFDRLIKGKRGNIRYGT